MIAKALEKPQGFYSYFAVHSLADGILKDIAIDCLEKILDKYLLVKPGDEVKAFTGANSTLGCLVMKFETLEGMLSMMDNPETWCHVILEQT